MKGEVGQRDTTSDEITSKSFLQWKYVTHKLEFIASVNIMRYTQSTFSK